MNDKKKSCKVVLLAHGLSVAGGRSVGQNIIESLGRIRRHYEYLIFAPQGVGYESISLPSRSKVIWVDPKLSKFKRIFFDLFVLSHHIRQFKPQIVWGLGNMGLTNPGAFQAILYHKPQLVYPLKNNPREKKIKRLSNELIRFQLRRSLKQTSLVFCQTPVMADRFRKSFNYDGDIALCPNAISGQLTDAESVRVPKVLEKLQGKFVLFVLTRYYAHKNLELLVETFNRYRNELADVTCLLTISPDDHPQAGELLDSIQRHKLSEQLVNIGNLPQNELEGHYRHVGALLLPTLLESFSGTYIEAMRFGCPIITSDLDFAQYVCGDAALYFDPWNPGELKDAILRLKSEPEQAGQLIDAGKSRLQVLTGSWDDIVDKAMGKIEQMFLESGGTG